MYDMTRFGETVSQLRKNKGMTQEEFAGILGLTAQAVSKWENGIGYPDITMMPRIAEALGVGMDTLFGVTEDKADFCREFEGLPLLHLYGNKACFGEKIVKKAENSLVIFEDGSTADLSTGVVKNYGRGEVRIIEVETAAESSKVKRTVYEEKFGRIRSLSISISMVADITVCTGESGRAYVKAEGSNAFISAMKASIEGDKLDISFSGNSNNGDGNHNRLTVFTGFEDGEELAVSASGYNVVRVNCGFEEGAFTINGSGEVECSSRIENAIAAINGSGSIRIASCNVSAAKINGSGCVEIKKVDKALSVTINGSGDIKAAGATEELGIHISGSGMVDAGQLCTKIAKIKVIGSGDVVVGNITESSEEKLSKSATLKVYKRG